VRVYERSTRELLGNFAIPGLGRFEGGAVASWPDSGDEPLFLFGLCSDAHKPNYVHLRIMCI
jgi:hypothetical protein